jgi:short subunit dehydrogenase-like uncharacterized protein
VIESSQIGEMSMPFSDRQGGAVARSPGRRRFDLVLYGATGFVGRQTVAYIANHPQLRGGGLRWAIAGRDAARLAAVQQGCGGSALQAGVLLAGADDARALQALARQASVVLSTAGPFDRLGSKLVAACVRNGTHYVDITGETPWVHGLIAQHQAQAARDGTRIVPCCGFDSVPSDLGVWMLGRAMQQRLGVACSEVKAAFAVRGGLNGGTVASALHLLETGQAARMADPFLLNPAGHRPPARAGDADPVRALFDADFDAWLAPFFMGPVNTRVVRRSAALLDYGPRFRYQEYLRVGHGPMAAATAAVLAAGMGLSRATAGWSPVRSLAARLAPRPGAGPTVADMDGGAFRCELIARSVNGELLRGRVADQGDPGNRSTTRMVCEAALALALDFHRLPGGRGLGGVLTPASALGEVLVERLHAAGMTLVVDG